MSDPMRQQGQPPMGQAPQGQAPQGQSPMGASPVTKNLSFLNPKDSALMASSGQINPNMSIRDFLAQQGVDVEGPVSQLVEMGKRQIANANPMTKARNIAADTALQKGGQPSPQPGVKPMVAPPGQPAPAGMEGLINKLGGR
jgi:hypothetical protein